MDFSKAKNHKMRGAVTGVAGIRSFDEIASLLSDRFENKRGDFK